VKVVAVFLVAILLSASCGSDSQGSSEADGAWTMESGTVGGEPMPLDPQYPVTMVIEGSEVSGRAACNSYGGSISIESSMVAFGDVFMTEMACDPAAMESEQVFLSALGLVDTIAVEADTLTLSGGGAELLFTRDAPIEDEALVGATWTLDTLIEGEAASSSLGESTFTLASDGTFEASTGCRELTGEYVVEGPEVIVTNSEAVGDCPAEFAPQDDLVVTVINDGFIVEIEGSRLTLTSSGGDGLSYTSEVEG
jgi:heat shock protein HslJ